MGSEWRTVTLNEAGVTLIDCDHKTPKAVENGKPYIGIPQLKNGRVILEGARLISNEDFSHWRRKALPMPNDVILSRRCNPGETAYVPEGLNIALGQNLVLLRATNESVYPPFLRWLAQGPAWWVQVNNFINVGAVFDSLKCADIPKFLIYLPPYQEQIKISEILRSLDEKIQINESVNQTLEQMAQALFKGWFVDFEPVKAKIAVLEAGGSQEEATLAAMTAISGKDTDSLVLFERDHPEQYAELKATAELFPSAMQESGLGEIPVGWELGKLQDLLVLQRGFDLPASARTDGEYPLIAASGPSGTHNKAMAKAPGVVTGRSGVLGKVFLVLEDYWPLNTTLWIKEFKRATPCYAYELLSLLDLKAFNAGSAVPSLNRNHVHSLCYPLPPMNLVKAFESIALLLHQRALNNTKKSQTLATLRDTLLPKLLSGEITLPEAEAWAAQVDTQEA